MFCYSIDSIAKVDISQYKNVLKKYAFNEKDSKGRKYPTPDKLPFLELNNPFFTDYCRLFCSSAFNKRSPYKTQVFNTAYNEHVCDRAVHSLYVRDISYGISNFLGLNSYLCAASSIGHDIGHTPLGHIIERLTNERVKKEGKTFSHEINTLNVAQFVENLNLCFETLECMMNHSRGAGELFVDEKLPLEYAVLMYSDKIAYTLRDVDDAFFKDMISGLNPDQKVLFKSVYSLGADRFKMIDLCAKSLILESIEKSFAENKGLISFSKGEVYEAFSIIKEEMYKHVYKKADFLDFSESSLKDGFNKIYDALEQAGLEEFNIKPAVSKPHPALIISLLKDDEFMGLIKNPKNITLDTITNLPTLKEILPNLMNSKPFNPFIPNLDWAN